MRSMIRALFLLLVIAAGVALIGVAAQLFFVARFYYTDGYNTQLQMHAPNGPRTWRGTIDYLTGLLLWSIPALVAGLPGMALIFFGLRRLATIKSSSTRLRQQTENPPHP